MVHTGNGRALFYCLGIGKSSSAQTLLGDVLIQQYYVDFDRQNRRWVSSSAPSTPRDALLRPKPWVYPGSALRTATLRTAAARRLARVTTEPARVVPPIRPASGARNRVSASTRRRSTAVLRRVAAPPNAAARATSSGCCAGRTRSSSRCEARIGCTCAT